MALYHRSKIRQLDFNNAFLNGELENLVYIRVLDGVKIDSKYSNPVLKVNKALYGLRESPKTWNSILDSFLLSIGFERCKLDECIYLLGNVYILVYVDDILIIGRDEMVFEEVIEKLKCSFQCRDLGIASSFLDLEIDHNIKAGNLRISQKGMIERISRAFHIENCNWVSTRIEENLSSVFDLGKLKKDEVDCNMQEKYRRLLGSLMYVMLGSKPYLSFSVSFFGQFQNCPNLNLYRQLLRVLNYL